MPDLQHAGNPADGVLRFSLASGDGQVIVCLDGELDAISAAGAWLALELAAAAGHSRITVDCTGLQFVDAAGLRVLIQARDRARATGGTLILNNPPAVIRRLLELTGWAALIGPHKPSGLAASSLGYDLGATYQAAVAAVLRISGASMGNLQLVDAATGDLRIVAHHGFGQPFLGFFATVHDDSSACGTALRHGVPVWVNDVAQSPIFAHTAARQVMLGAGSRAVASLPIRTPGGKMIAMISAHHDRPVEWPAPTRVQLEELARLTGRLVERQLPMA